MALRPRTTHLVGQPPPNPIRRRRLARTPRPPGTPGGEGEIRSSLKLLDSRITCTAGEAIINSTSRSTASSSSKSSCTALKAYLLKKWGRSVPTPKRRRCRCRLPHLLQEPCRLESREQPYARVPAMQRSQGLHPGALSSTLGADSGPSEANAQVRSGHRHSPLGASPSNTATRIASTRVWCQPIAQYESVASAHSWPASAHLRCPVTAPAVLVGEVPPRSLPPRETVPGHHVSAASSSQEIEKARAESAQASQ